MIHLLLDPYRDTVYGIVSGEDFPERLFQAWLKQLLGEAPPATEVRDYHKWRINKRDTLFNLLRGRDLPEYFMNEVLIKQHGFQKLEYTSSCIALEKDR